MLNLNIIFIGTLTIRPISCDKDIISKDRVFNSLIINSIQSFQLYLDIKIKTKAKEYRLIL